MESALIKIERICEYCSSLSRKELTDFAKDCYGRLYTHFRESRPKSNAEILLSGSVYTVIAYDRQFHQGEWQFVSEVIGGMCEDEAFDSVSQFAGEKNADAVAQLAASLPSDMLEAFWGLCIAALASDGRLSSYDKKLLLKIFCK